MNCSPVRYHYATDAHGSSEKWSRKKWSIKNQEMVKEEMVKEEVVNEEVVNEVVKGCVCYIYAMVSHHN